MVPKEKGGVILITTFLVFTYFFLISESSLALSVKEMLKYKITLFVERIIKTLARPTTEFELHKLTVTSDVTIYLRMKHNNMQ